ncbi:MAG: nucleoside triphosphate pyrophosphohydrolase [Bacteroidales bacterium]|nr:nucleoside triphosphate pyrophosphohydrolase [Bacteroidales bacterium]
MESKTYTAFERLSDILDTLRQECPWDRVQTFESLRHLTIEEVHELSEAVVSGDTTQLKKELGDLAMHVMFYCKLAEEAGLFSTADMYNAICDKLVARHPFIYHKEDYHGESWEQLKMREKDRRGVLDGVPDSLPSLIKAQRMQDKVAGMENGEWKVEGGEWNEEMNEEEFGDYLFAIVDWARRHGINADDALCGANHRFKKQIENRQE